MYTIVSHKKGLYQIRNRLFFGLASSDIVLTTWMILGSIPLPAEGLGLMLGGKGNTRTCTAQGFFLQLAFAVPLYNAAIMVYYLLVIRYQIQDFRRIEPFLHGIAILLPLGLAIAGLFLKAFNPGPVGLCFAYPCSIRTQWVAINVPMEFVNVVTITNGSICILVLGYSLGVCWSATCV
jgi:hypothetical protein